MGTDPLRILCVFSTLDRGGAESMCMNLYRKIDRTKVQFDFVKHTSQKGAFEDEIVKLGGKVFQAPVYKIHNAITYHKWWKSFFRKHPEYRIVHGHYYTIADIYLAEAKKANRITIVHSHSTGVRGAGLKAHLKLCMAKKAVNHADYRMACSMDSGRWLYGNKSFTVLNNAINIEDYSYNLDCYKAIRSEYGLENAFVLGTVGSLTTVKNPKAILAIAKAMKEVQRSTVLLWIGAGPLKTEIETMIKEMGMSTYVRMLGERNDVNRLLQGMDAFILPSLHEGLPLSLIEAQAAGLPCYASNNVSDEAKVTELCHFLPLGAWDEWAEAINDKAYPRMNTAQQLLEAGYDVKQTSGWLTSFYEEILNEETFDQT